MDQKQEQKRESGNKLCHGHVVYGRVDITVSQVGNCQQIVVGKLTIHTEKIKIDSHIIPYKNSILGGV